MHQTGRLDVVIHYNTGEFYVMPVSGKHYRMLCGKTFQDNHKPDAKRHTMMKNMVTCKNCLKKLMSQADKQ